MIKMMHKPLLNVVMICLVIAIPHGAAARAVDRLQLRQWTIDGVQREALVSIPESAQQKAAPVVFTFHGHGGSMQKAARMFQMHELWPEAICVYMQGLNTPGRLTDPEGKKPGWQHSVGDQGDRDLRFFDAVLATLHKEAKVDDQRIFSTGHSNGGGFTYLLWAQRGDRLKAVAPSASAAARSQSSLKPKPVLHIAGKNDPLVKYEWQAQTIAALRRLNKCAENATSWADGLCQVYASPIHAPVVTLIHDGDHKFPPRAPRKIVQFFQQVDSL